MCAAAVTDGVYSLRVVRHRGQPCRSLPSNNEFKEEQYVFSMGRMVKIIILGWLLGSKPIVGDCYRAIGFQDKPSGQYTVISFIFTMSNKVVKIVGV